MLKRRIKDPITGISYEENGHYCDNIRYKLYVDNLQSFNKFKDNGKTHDYSLGNKLTDRMF